MNGDMSARKNGGMNECNEGRRDEFNKIRMNDCSRQTHTTSLMQKREQ